ncbi:MAG: AraC family transcriptional regulator [Sphingobacteriales bacterium SCN 48-20]|jgi:AraC family transcriptional activator of pobA|uniref:helix-turn-helix domain-containing protein n=1 Tax=Terrimonas ferruginea TaxID=249 RepID=UPI00086E712B|nr:response regulator transcription factor [Terrimonas ferruginea]MBN8783761.1 helix-turn-helix transcriptional regulator [Terrimonas ferruginea]ODT91240.1 MAG: AraC family transcriptional regulator [Sphingobacteriales bacterium SCN 48-20]OJW40808.1 MAG: AraC family transcriptional regulator [Sphingobacteriales bacterium 48-107]
MKNKNEKLVRFISISESHEAFGLPKPQHPLISLVHFNEKNPFNTGMAPIYDVLSFYKITFITHNAGRLKYGRDYYDYNEGSMLFLAPNQLVGSTDYNSKTYCYILLIHPDFLLGHPLATKIRQYGYFAYSANEALHLSDSERKTILSIYENMEQELNSRVDEFSQEVMIAQIELLLSYVNRFYKRQFITRKVVNDDILQKTETILDDYFNNLRSLQQGLPTVQFLSQQLNLSPGYLSDMLRSLIGLNAQQYIHEKLIGKAKERLTTTKLSVAEIAYELGFEHSQSFSKLFKNKTNQSPLEFRDSFN